MAESIDSLSIQITANAKGANTAIKNLTQNLTGLSSTLKNLSIGNLAGLSDGIKSISASMSEFKKGDVDAKTFGSLVKGIKKFGEIDGTKLAALAQNLKPIADSARLFSGLNIDSKSFNAFANSIKNLANAPVEKLANVDFDNIGNKISNLVNKIASAEQVSRPVVSLVAAIARLASAGTNASAASSALPSLATNLQKLINTLARAPALQQSTVAITQAVAQLASAGNRAKAAADNLVSLGQNLRKAIEEIAKAPKVKESVVATADSLARIAKTGSSAGKAVSSLSKTFNVAGRAGSKFKGVLGGVSSGMGTLRKSSLKAVTSFKSLTRQILSAAGIAGGLYAAFQGIRKSIDISSDLTEVQNVVDVTFGDMAYKVEELAKTSIQQFGMSELTLKQVASRFQAMGVAMNIPNNLIKQSSKFLSKNSEMYGKNATSMADMSLELTKLTADLASFYNQEQDVIAEKLESVFTGQTKPLRALGLDLTQATLQEWAMKNGIDANVRSMSQAEKTMLRYQYIMANTGAAQSDFIRTQGMRSAA